MLALVVSAKSVISIAETVPASPAKNEDGGITHADGKVCANDPNILFTGKWEEGDNGVYFSGWQTSILQLACIFYLQGQIMRQF